MSQLWNTTTDDLREPLEAEGLDGDELLRALEMMEQELERERNQALDRLNILGNRLQGEIKDAKQARERIERRWAQDLRQYYGVFKDEDVNSAVGDDARSRINVTRSRTNQLVARAYDMLFPSDDSNYDLTTIEALGDHGEDVGAEVERCNRMKAQIRDQLNEARYEAKCRDVIEKAGIIGTGILKGPTIRSKARGIWRQEATSSGEVVHMEVMEEAKTPGVEVVDPINFFPAKGTLSSETMERCFERHVMSKRQLRDLSKQPGYIKQQIRKLIGMEPDHTPDEAMRLIQEISDPALTTTVPDQYEVWECHRELEKEDLLAAGIDMDIDDDELVGYYGEVWVCQGIVIKVRITHMEGETSPPYSFFCWEKDHSSPFGFGVPYMSRHQARVINTTWQMLLDNASLSTGPQIVLNKKLIRPADGKWEITPRKIWFLEEEIPSQSTTVGNAFNAFDIPFNQEQLSTLQNMAFNFVDVETNAPDVYAGGESGQQQQQTAQGTAIMVNQKNVPMKRIAKNWDDDVTTLLIGRFYRWNMLYNEDADIKGNFDIVPKGVSHLAVKDLQAQNYMVMMQAIDHPVYGRYIRPLPALKNWASLLNMPVKEIIKTEEEVQQEMEDEAGQVSPQDQAAMITAQSKERQVELEGMKLELERERMDREHAMKTEDMQIRHFESSVVAYRIDKMYELEMAKQAMKRDQTMDQLNAQLGIARTSADAMIQAAQVRAQSQERNTAYKAQADAVKEAVKQ